MNGAIERLMEELAYAVGRIAELERKLDNSMRHGKVTDIDTKKQLARIEIGERDGKPVKSAWVPYAQLAGEYKSHRPPTVGQQMTMVAPNGEVRQALLLPFTWSDQNQSPSDKPDEHVTSYGKLKILEKADRYEISVDGKAALILSTEGAVLKFGETEIELTSSKLSAIAEAISVAGSTYLGQTAKGRLEGQRVETEGGPALKTFAKV